MANLKKHFGFKVGGGCSNGGASMSGAGPAAALLSPQMGTGELLLPGFSKSAFMNEVSSLLEHCGLYVSAMNGFCTSGCSLAKCLVKVFHAVPLYRETASTLLTNWEEIAQTTAAASASVKTETLMQLQDVLTRLEGHSGESKETELAESVHAVSSCLMAYIELQAQFSYLVSKALGKLSRQQNNGPGGFLKNSSRAEEAVRKQFAQIINRLTGPSAKTPTSPTTPLPVTPPTPQTPSQLTSAQHVGGGISSGTCTGSSVWPAEIHLAPSGGELASASPPSGLVSSGEAEVEDSGLDDVINLLSIGGAIPCAAAAAASSQAPGMSGPPKVPPRPDAVSQDAFRLKQQLEALRGEPSVAKKPGESAITSWSPFAPSQWGNPDWSTENTGDNWKCSTESHHSSETTDSDPNWLRWQVGPGVFSGAESGSNIYLAREKTSTWPRPLRDPAAPWEWSEVGDHEDKLLVAEGMSREVGERVTKTCTWPLKVPDGAWSSDPTDQWSNKDVADGHLENLVLHRNRAHSERDAVPQAWEQRDPSDRPFQLFTLR